MPRGAVRRDMLPQQVKKELDRGTVLLDTRDTASFGELHIPGSITIGFAKQNANWIGMVIEPDAELILVITSEKAYTDMLVELHRIGYDKVIGYLCGGMTSWQEAGWSIDQLLNEIMAISEKHNTCHLPSCSMKHRIFPGMKR